MYVYVNKDTQKERVNQRERDRDEQTFGKAHPGVNRMQNNKYRRTEFPKLPSAPPC